jgi:hypothetical protein
MHIQEFDLGGTYYGHNVDINSVDLKIEVVSP